MSTVEIRERSEQSIGRRLEQARRRRGLSLKEAEKTTKIHSGHLEKIERDDFDALPHAAYAPILLKAYANYLELDGEALARELKPQQQTHRRERPAQTAYRGPLERESRRPWISPSGPAGAGIWRKSQGKRRIWPLWVSMGKTFRTGVIIVLAFLVAVQALTLLEPSLTPAGEDDEPQPAQDSRATDEPKTEEVWVVVEVQGAPSWLDIKADGELAFLETAQPGFSQVFDARQDVEITAGNAGAVQIVANGRELGAMGASGEVLTSRYAVEQGG